MVGWARSARYVTTTDVRGDIQLRSEAGVSTRYYVRRRGADRLELTQTDESDVEEPLLFVADIEVLERYLLGLFADDIRDDLELPFLELPYSPEDLAPGFELSGMARGYRTLSRPGRGPVAAAPDPTLSLLALVPLSHLLGWSIVDLRQAFLNGVGSPLLLNGRYRAV